MKKVILILLTLCSLVFFSSAQEVDFTLPDSANAPLNPEDFDYETLEEVLLIYINKNRHEKGLDMHNEHQILKKASNDEVNFMISYGTTEIDKAGETAKKYGATDKIAEVVAKVSIKEGKDFKSSVQIAEEITSKWKETPKTGNDIIMDRLYFFIGISANIDEEGKKVYVVALLGNNASFKTEDNPKKAEFISTKTCGITGYNSVNCSKCKKFPHLYELSSGLYIENDQVFFKYDDFKALKKLIKNPNDGLSADFIDYDQFPCDEENIIDYSYSHKGLLFKRLLLADLEKYNTDQTGKSLNVKLGDLPKAMEDNEVNLVIIQNKSICANLPRTYIEIPKGEYSYTSNYTLYKDLKIPELSNSVSAISDEEMNGIIERAKDPTLRNNNNMFNAVYLQIKKNAIKGFAQLMPCYSYIDRLKMSQSFPKDTVTLLELELLLYVIDGEQFDAAQKAEAVTKLTSIDIPELPIENVYSLAMTYIKIKEYKEALNILEPYVLKDDFNIDMLFSYITISTLFKDRLNSSILVRAFQKANARDNKRYCGLWENNRLSFQVFENQSLKTDYCSYCEQ